MADASTPQIDDRVTWTGVRSGAARHGVIVSIGADTAEIRTAKGGYTEVPLTELTVTGSGF